MLNVDLAGSSQKDLAGEVAERCSGLGQVCKVTVYAARLGPPTRPFAIVSMATREQAENVAAALGGRTVGHSVIVFLEQPAKPGFPPPDNAGVLKNSHRE